MHHHFDTSRVRAGIREIVSRRAAVGLGIGVVANGSLEVFEGHGYADVATATPITEDTVFRIASITKTFTAIAIMQLWEQGLLDLDAPANDYLRAYRLVPANPAWRPATVRHLLTHTAGIAEVVPSSGVFRPDFGESVEDGEPLPTLADFYGGALRVHAEPGTRFCYGNHSPATLGQIVEDVSGRPLDAYLREHVFESLGMADTDLTPSPRLRERLATGYTLHRDGARPVAHRTMITTAAASAYSTPADMARYVVALLGRGANTHGAVLKPATLDMMFAPHYQPDPRIPGIGLTFFRGDADGHPIVEHQGILPGFDSQVLVAPEDGVGVIAFTNGARFASMWLPTEATDLLHDVLGVPRSHVRSDVPQRPDVWADLCGWYHLPARVSDVRIRALVGAGVEVLVRGGQLVVRCLHPVPALARPLPLHPDDDTDPYVFRLALSPFGFGSIRVVFGPHRRAGTMAMHLDVMPLTGLRQPEATNPRRWAAGALGMATVGTALLRRSVRRRRQAAVERPVTSPSR